MPLNIKDPEADRLARALARETGESLTQAVVQALRERLTRQKRKRGNVGRRAKLRALRESTKALPVLDSRSAEEILGFDDEGLPH